MTTANEPSDAEIERVAASMYEALSRDLKDKWPKATNGQKAVYRKQARAAILAMDRRVEPPAAEAPCPVPRAALVDYLKLEFSDTYDCIRVWEGWAVGSMSEDDFEPVTDRIEAIADELLVLLSRFVPAPAAEAPARVVPEGYWLAPEDPSDEMWTAYFNAVDVIFARQRDEARAEGRGWKGMPAVVWEALRAAAPAPPATRSEEPDGWIALDHAGKQWLIFTQQEADHNTRHGVTVRPYWLSPVPSTDTQGGWRYEIQYGPEGEAIYAWVYDGSGTMICTAKTHHAKQIVSVVNGAPSTDADLDYRQAFLAQSRKLQHVLDIPGVKDALADLEWETLDTGEAMLTDLRNEGIEAAVSWLEEEIDAANDMISMYPGDPSGQIAAEVALLNACATAIRNLKETRDE
jgi:hypothetical protein